MAFKINSGELQSEQRKIRKFSYSALKKKIGKFKFKRVSQLGRKIMSFARNVNRRNVKLEPELRSWGNTEFSYNTEYSTYDRDYKIINVHKNKLQTFPKNKLIEKKSDKTKESIDDDINCFSQRGLRMNVKQYLLRSTLHGLRYIGDGHLSLIERVFWFVAVFLAVIMAAYFIGNIYDHWDSTPMIVTLNPENIPLTSIPFPAITICNMNIVRKSTADKILSEGSAVDKKLLEGLCNMNNESAIVDIDSMKAGEWAYFKRFLINVAQPCNQMLTLCKWKSEQRSCDSLFNIALTDEGLCCTFNGVHREMMFRNPRDLSDLNITFPFPAVDWTPENGYPYDAPVDGFPWRPIGAGANLGLTLVLDAAVNEYYCSSTNSVGFKILLHNPAETPKIADFGDLIQPGKEIRIVTKPRIHDAQPHLINLPLRKRRCYFSKEKQLVYYRTYTQKNCAMECEAKLTTERCNCSQYFMPKNSSVRICGMTDAKCYTSLKIAIEDKLGINESAAMIHSNCDYCMPSCFELSYGKEMTSGLLTETLAISDEMLSGKTLEYFVKNMAILHIYFVDGSFVRFTKDELFGFTDFLSNTGGLLGLFLGFSFLSFIEIIYFLTLRILCTYYRRNYTKSTSIYPFSQ